MLAPEDAVAPGSGWACIVCVLKSVLAFIGPGLVSRFVLEVVATGTRSRRWYGKFVSRLAWSMLDQWPALRRVEVRLQSVLVWRGSKDPCVHDPVQHCN